MKRDIDLKWVNPEELINGKNPRNWKSHPDRQKKTVSAIIKRNGWARPLVWNLKTKRLIDGHGRLEIAIEEGWKEVPVLMGSWSEAQEKELLASLDTTSDMAQIDAHALDSLTKEIAKSVEEIVGTDTLADEIMKASIDINAFAHDVKPRSPVIKRRGARRKIGNEKIKVPTVRKADRKYREILEQRQEEDSVVYESTNEWGLPDLLAEDCYKDIRTLPNVTWNGSDRVFDSLSWVSWSQVPFKGKKEGGFLHFYTDDYRFTRLYKYSNNYTNNFAAWDFYAICEPDFSTYSDWPFAARLWQLYKSRWVANFFAEKCGAKIIPLIRRCENPDKDRPWLYDTLPDVPVYSVNCSQSNIGKKQGREARIRDSISAAIDGKKNVKVILLNGGLEHQNHLEGWLPKGPKYVFLETYMTARRRYLDGLLLKKRKL